MHTTAQQGQQDRLARMQRYGVGDWVQIQGLRTATEHNGACGVVTGGIDSAGGRYPVRIDGARKPLGLKPTNLKPIATKYRLHCIPDKIEDSTYVSLWFDIKCKADSGVAIRIDDLTDWVSPDQRADARVYWRPGSFRGEYERGPSGNTSF